MKWIHSCESVFGKTGGKGGGVVVSDATAANGLFGTAGTNWELWNKKFHSFPRPGRQFYLCACGTKWEVLNP